MTGPAVTGPAVEVLGAVEAERGARRVAGALDRLGIRAGDRVLFSLPSSAALLQCVLGAARHGVVPVILNPTLTHAERAVLVDDADPSLLVEDRAGLAALLSGPEVELHPAPVVRPMHYTSGTTGRPKGVWSGVLTDSEAGDLVEDEAQLWGFSPDDVHLVCSPLHHSVSVRLASAALWRGARLVVLERFDADQVADVLTELRPTTTFMAPTALGRLLRSDKCPVVIDGLRLLVHAGSSCPPALKRHALARLRPGALWEFYGSTEGQFTVCAPDEWSERPGTVGRARPGRRVAIDADGVVWCHAPSFARFTYWRDPESSAKAWRGDAFTVGDVGRLDAEGYLYLDGRRDDLVISGGVNVYPAEVEAVLTELAGVEEVAVFGVEDDDWGQRVCAAVVGDVAEDALRQHAASRLAPYKRPKRYFIVDALPHTATGKLRRGEVAESVGLVPPRRVGHAGE